MSKKPSDKEASEAATEAHSDDPETRKAAMAKLRERQGQGDKEGAKDK